MKQHVVRQGECFSGIAKQHGFTSYKTLYQHPANADLKKRRPNPNLLFPGDVIAIPDKEPKDVKVPTGDTHKFQIKTARKVLRVRLETATGERITDHAYTLTWHGAHAPPLVGKTDGDGVVEHEVPPNALGADLHVESEPRARVLRFSHLNPLRGVPDEGASGAQARLANLGYDPGPIDGRVGKWTRAAARTFARDNDLKVTDPLAPALLAALEKAHGS